MSHQGHIWEALAQGLCILKTQHDIDLSANQTKEITMDFV